MIDSLLTQADRLSIMSHMATKPTMTKAYNWTNTGKLVSAVDVSGVDEARKLATEWNKRLGKRGAADHVAIITNNRVQAHSTIVTVVA